MFTFQLVIILQLRVKLFYSKIANFTIRLVQEAEEWLNVARKTLIATKGKGEFLIPSLLEINNKKKVLFVAFAESLFPQFIFAILGKWAQIVCIHIPGIGCCQRSLPTSKTVRGFSR